MKINKYLLTLATLAGIVCFFSGEAKAKECSIQTTCGESCDYGDQTYNTVLIGDQCWFQENLNVGLEIENTQVPDETASTPNDPSSVQKWCYDDSSTNCANEGGLYTWAEANALSHSCNSVSCDIPTPNQGICPSGWHIPTDTELHELEDYLKATGQSCDGSRDGWDCSDAGIKLKIGGSSGFNAISAGNHETNGEDSRFDKREPSAHFWSASPCLACSNYGHAYNRALNMGSDSDMVSRGWSLMAHGLSARCLKNDAVGPPTEKKQCKKGGWKIFNNPTFKNQGRCVMYVEKEELRNAIERKWFKFMKNNFNFYKK